MFSTLITVTLFVSLAIQSTFAGFAINDPPLTQVLPLFFTTSGHVLTLIVSAILYKYHGRLVSVLTRFKLFQLLTHVEPLCS